MPEHQNCRLEGEWGPPARTASGRRFISLLGRCTEPLGWSAHFWCSIIGISLVLHEIELLFLGEAPGLKAMQQIREERSVCEGFVVQLRNISRTSDQNKHRTDLGGMLPSELRYRGCPGILDIELLIRDEHAHKRARARTYRDATFATQL